MNGPDPRLPELSLLMITNLVIIAFLIAMVYIWWMQGFFSGLLHLGLTVGAGALTLAFWHPLAYLLLSTGSQASAYAWSLSLLVLLIAFLSIGRILLDKFIPGNVHFPGLVSGIGGGLCGLGSGILIAGLTVIGLQFLPMGSPALGGYTPWIVGPRGQVKHNQRLWVLPVDRMAAGFYTSLSEGAFARTLSNISLASRYPHLSRAAGEYRLTALYDANAAYAAAPGDVAVTGVYSRPTPVEKLDPALARALGPAVARRGNRQLVVIDTLWKLSSVNTTAGTLRVPPTQIRLLARTSDGRVVSHPPAAVTHVQNPRKNKRVTYAINSNRVYGSTVSQKQTFAWAFVIPRAQTPVRLRARQLVLNLPRPKQFNREPMAMVRALGRLKPFEKKEDKQQKHPEQPRNQVGRRQGAVVGHKAKNIKATNQLPEPISKNDAPGLSYDQGQIVSGSTETSRRSTGGEDLTVKGIYDPPQLQVVRLKLTADRAQSLLGGIYASAARLQSVWLEDDHGQRWRPTAFVWRKGDMRQEITVDISGKLGMRDLQRPLQQIKRGQHLFLYFHVQPGVTIARYQLGSKTYQNVNLPVPAD